MTAFGAAEGARDARTVLVALHDPLLNGASISVLRVVPFLERMGWRFAFLVPRPGPAFDWLQERGADVHGEPRPIASSLIAAREPPGVARRLADSPGYLWRFRRLLRQVSPDLVHANSLFSFAEALTARALRYPTVFHLHDMAPTSRKAGAASAIARRGVDVAVAVSETCAASYRRDGWTPRVVYEAAPMPERRVTIRANPRPFVAGTVGVVARRKGGDVFVAAARRVLEEGRGIELRMVGAATDPLERSWGEAVIAEAREVGIRHSYRADVLEELRSWDAFVLPSRIDPCPIVLLEAMAIGLPVIGARAGGIAEQITPDCGILVEPEDPEALAGAIRSIASLGADERASMGDAGRKRVRERFSLERQAEGLDLAYRDALAKRSPPCPRRPGDGRQS